MKENRSVTIEEIEAKIQFRRYHYGGIGLEDILRDYGSDIFKINRKTENISIRNTRLSRKFQRKLEPREE